MHTRLQVILILSLIPHLGTGFLYFLWDLISGVSALYLIGLAFIIYKKLDDLKKVFNLRNMDVHEVKDHVSRCIYTFQSSLENISLTEQEITNSLNKLEHSLQDVLVHDKKSTKMWEFFLQELQKDEYFNWESGRFKALITKEPKPSELSQLVLKLRTLTNKLLFHYIPYSPDTDYSREQGKQYTLLLHEALKEYLTSQQINILRNNLNNVISISNYRSAINSFKITQIELWENPVRPDMPTLTSLDIKVPKRNEISERQLINVNLKLDWIPKGAYVEVELDAVGIGLSKLKLSIRRFSCDLEIKCPIKSPYDLAIHLKNQPDIKFDFEIGNTIGVVLSQIITSILNTVVCDYTKSYVDDVITVPYNFSKSLGFVYVQSNLEGLQEEPDYKESVANFLNSYEVLEKKISRIESVYTESGKYTRNQLMQHAAQISIRILNDFLEKSNTDKKLYPLMYSSLLSLSSCIDGLSDDEVFPVLFENRGEDDEYCKYIYNFPASKHKTIESIRTTIIAKLKVYFAHSNNNNNNYTNSPQLPQRQEDTEDDASLFVSLPVDTTPTSSNPSSPGPQLPSFVNSNNYKLIKTLNLWTKKKHVVKLEPVDNNNNNGIQASAVLTFPPSKVIIDGGNFKGFSKDSGYRTGSITLRNESSTTPITLLSVCVSNPRLSSSTYELKPEKTEEFEYDQEWKIFITSGNPYNLIVIDFDYSNKLPIKNLLQMAGFSTMGYRPECITDFNAKIESNSIIVTWKPNSYKKNPKDWLGVFPANEKSNRKWVINNSSGVFKNELWCRSPSSTTCSDNEKVTVKFDKPSAPGEYEVRYFSLNVGKFAVFKKSDTFKI
eukprot:TRINITY_DN652_c1_g1_i1.p1 TRINITY_DN652_c1_g1~~TRINITY_DN652_c1_g1_i1.p1  ORF type:complete len:836 (+),score=170.68 TRINITY_DN652_c1_g1_i1:7-2514(+)